MSMFQDHEVCESSAIIVLLLYIIECNLNLVNKNLFQILEFHYTTEINNKWNTQYCCLLYMIYNTLMLPGRYVLCSFQV
jgi:hypothetical protein